MFIQFDKNTNKTPSGAKEETTYINTASIAKIVIERSENANTFAFISSFGETLFSKTLNTKEDTDPQKMKEMEALAAKLLNG